ncbi:type II toxin-antitoxin system VapB family antitoxin [Oerskovia jenensis]
MQGLWSCGAPGEIRAVAPKAPPRLARMIFKAVGDGRPYPDHGLVTPKDWSSVPPRQVRLDELVTTKRTLNLDNLLSEDSTFYGDLFAHVVEYQGVLYLEDGLHRAVRAALQQRAILHARVLMLNAPGVG